MRTLIVTLILTLSMTVGALVQGMALAAAPGNRGALHEITICATGSGEATVTIDASGNRVEPEGDACPHPCPECLGAATLALAPVNASAPRAALFRRLSLAAVAQPDRPHAHGLPAARAPPQKV